MKEEPSHTRQKGSTKGASLGTAVEEIAFASDV